MSVVSAVSGGEPAVPASHANLGIDGAFEPADARSTVPERAALTEPVAADGRPRRPDTPGADQGHGLRLAVSQQAELLALLVGSVRAGADRPPGDSPGPTGAIDLIGGLGGLEHDDAPGRDPLWALAVVGPRLAQDADNVVAALGGRGQAA